MSTAQELQITIQVKEMLNRNFQMPDDEFTRYFVRNLNDGKYTAKLVDQYRPIVKKSIASVINDIISDRLNVAMKNENKEEKQMPQGVENENQQPNEMNEEKLPDGVVFQDREKGIVTTQEEIDAYNIVRSILRQYVDVSRIQYNDYKTYFP